MREIVKELKSLRLHGMASRYEELLAQGGAGIQSAEWLIRALLEAEVTDRHVRSIRYQMGAARFPVHRDLAGFDFSQSKVDKSLIDQLARCEFTDSATNVVLIGGTGTGKSHLATTGREGDHAARQTGALLPDGGARQCARAGEGPG